MAIVVQDYGRYSHRILFDFEGRLNGPVLQQFDEALGTVKRTLQRNPRVYFGTQVNNDVIAQVVTTFSTVSAMTGDPMDPAVAWMPGRITPVSNTNPEKIEFIVNAARAHFHNWIDEHPTSVTDSTKPKTSDWVLVGVVKIEVYLNAGTHWLANMDVTGFGQHELPASLDNQHTQCVLNIQNGDDQMCFRYCLVAWKMWQNDELPKDHRERVTNYQGGVKRKRGRPSANSEHAGPRDVGLDFSMCPPDNVEGGSEWLTKFERANDIGVYVYGWDEVVVGEKHMAIAARLLRSPGAIYRNGEVQLLLYKKHYSLITNIDVFLSNRRTLMKTTTSHDQHWCYRCMKAFKRKDVREEHMKTCRTCIVEPVTDKRLYRLPQQIDDRTPTAKFDRHETMMKYPCFVVFDLETYYDPVNEGKVAGSNERVASFAYAAVGLPGVFEVPEEHRFRIFRDAGDPDGIECVVKGIKALYELWWCIEKANGKHPLPKLTVLEEEVFKRSTKCFLCGKTPKKVEVTEMNEVGVLETKMVREELVREHCHFTGRYRGAACKSCNAKLVVRRLPCFAHNFGGFDSGPVMRALCRIQSESEFPYSFSVIAKSADKFVKADFGRLRFQDSMRYLDTNLDNIIHAFRDDDPGKGKCPKTQEQLSEIFKLMRERHPSGASDLDLLLRKVPFPYSALTGPECWADDMPVPDWPAFTNDLAGGEPISDGHKQLVERVKQVYSIRNFKEYHDLYLATDVLALADCLSRFRDACYELNGIDVIQYLTLPTYSWQAMLKKTKVEIELTCDYDMHELVESGIRGGLCVPFQPYAVMNDPAFKKASCEEVRNLYDESKEPRIGLYLDATSLYGWCMEQPLPIGGQKKINLEVEQERFEHMYDKLKTFSMGSNMVSPVGYIYNVDYTVPEELHDKLDFAPIVKRPIILDGEETAQEGAPEKLYPSLLGDHHAVLSLPLLHMYWKMGIKIEAVHEVWQYHQEPYMREYVQDMARRRGRATSEVMKQAIKLQVCSLYGMTVVNKANRRELVPYTDGDVYERAVARLHRPGMRAFIHYQNGNDILAFRERVPHGGVLCNSPRIVGFAVLDYAKQRMYDFWYNGVKVAFPRALLLYTDTDSKKICIPGVETPFEAMERIEKESKRIWFDYSNGEKGMGWPVRNNRKQAGYFKLESVDDDTGKVKPIVAYAAPEAKCMAIRFLQEVDDQYKEAKEHLRCKGTPKVAVRNQLDFTKFEQAARDHIEIRTNYTRLQTQKLKAMHLLVERVSMRGNNDKVWLNPEKGRAADDERIFVPVGYKRTASSDMA